MRASPGLRQIAALISFAAFGAVLIDQQLNMAAEQFRGDEDTITSFLASVRFLLSTTALLIQVLFVKQIYRRLGVGFALLMLPMSLGVTATLILISGALWAPAVASVVDRSIRYTVDRTTREIFFLPLSPTVRQRAKSFVDVTVDRIARGAAAVLILVLIKPWGLALGWPQLSIVTLVVVALWSAMALRAKTRYIATVRKGLETQVVQPTTVRLDVADLTTVEALLEELAHPEHRVLYAIDMLEALDKRNLVTPLLLHHASPAVRARAVGVLGGSRPAIAKRWQSMIHKLVDDPDPEVRGAGHGPERGCNEARPDARRRALATDRHQRRRGPSRKRQRGRRRNRGSHVVEAGHRHPTVLDAGQTDVLQLSKSGQRMIGQVDRAPFHAATSNSLLMN